ncbi:MAG: hypothetical protein KC619_19515, partial [Myxococcales bacterium]|nr:hypothetical protein [Myxococcales bacterium]
MPRASSSSSPGSLSAVLDDDELELDRAPVRPEASERDLDDLDDEDDEDGGPALVLVAPPRPPPLLAAVVPLAAVPPDQHPARVYL